MQPLINTVPGLQVTATEPHSLCAVIFVAQTGGVGLQPRSVVPLTQLSKTGAVVSVQINVLEQVVVNPQADAV